MLPSRVHIASAIVLHHLSKRAVGTEARCVMEKKREQYLALARASAKREAKIGANGEDGGSSDFDDGIYRLLLPILKEGVAHLENAGDHVIELINALVAEFREVGLDRGSIERMRPYMRRFVDGVRSGRIKLVGSLQGPTKDPSPPLSVSELASFLQERLSRESVNISPPNLGQEPERLSTEQDYLDQLTSVMSQKMGADWKAEAAEINRRMVDEGLLPHSLPLRDKEQFLMEAFSENWMVRENSNLPNLFAAKWRPENALTAMEIVIHLFLAESA